MAKIEFNPVKAERKNAKARIACCGPAGAGKTHSSLRLAGELGERILLIDTENHSGEMEAGKPGIPEYFVFPIEPPFEPNKFIDAVKAAEENDFDVVIIDSLSHAWAGSGGLLDQQGKIADRGTNSFTAWRQITPKHNSLVDAMLQSSCHIIATMRSKQEYVIEENERGKKAPKKVGLAPVQREGLEYEFTIVFDIDQKTHTAISTKDRTSLFPPDSSFVLSNEIGQKIKAWLESGEAPAPEEVPAPEPVKATAAATKEVKEEASAEAAEKPLTKAEKNKLVVLAKESGFSDIKKAITLFLGELDGQLSRSDANTLAAKMKEHSESPEKTSQEVPF